METPRVSTMRPAHVRRSAPPSQQTPPSAQRPPATQTQSTVIPSSQRSIYDIASDDDPIEDFSQVATSQSILPNAFERMRSSQRQGNARMSPRWLEEEDAVLIKGIRQGWTAFEMARELERTCQNAINRTESAIRGRKKTLIEKLNLQVPAPTGPTRLRVDKRQRWTPAETSTLNKGVRDGLDAATLHQQSFPYRSLKSIEHKVRKRKLRSKDPVKGTPQKIQSTLLPPASRPIAAQPEDQVVENAPRGVVESGPRGIHVQENISEDQALENNQEVVAQQTDESNYESLDDDFDFTSVPTAFVALKTAQPEKPGRLRRPTAASRHSNRTPRSTAEQHAPAPAPPPADEIHVDVFNSSPEPEESQPQPKKRRRTFYGDWDPEERWQQCLYMAGGNKDAAKRRFRDSGLTARMFDAIADKDYPLIDTLKAERTQMELRWAIEDGRARRIDGRPINPNLDDADEEVLREDEWEIFAEAEDDNDDEMMDWAGEDSELEPQEDMIRDRVIEEVEDEEEEVAPPVDDRRTPIQAMRAISIDDGLPTPLPTNEKITPFGIDSKQPSSSVPTDAPSETTFTSDMSTRSKRARRRSRNANLRHSSGFGRKHGGERKSSEAPASSAAQPKAPVLEAEDPFMAIVRNARISSPPRRKAEPPVRSRGSPSPPAWFAHSDEDSDSSSDSE